MAALLAIIVGIAIILGVYAGIWWLWCWTLPQLWPTGPENLINPGFWLFIVAMFLLSFIGRLIFGCSKKSKP